MTRKPEHATDANHADDPEEFERVEFVFVHCKHDEVRDDRGDVDPDHGAVEELGGVG